MDVDNIPAGTDFVDYLNKQVAACDIFLVIIGPNWLDARDSAGRLRLENPNDYVAVEIEAALKRNIPVVPIIVDGARLPRSDELPEPIKALARRNAVEIRNKIFRRDIAALIYEVGKAIEYKRSWFRRRRNLLIVVGLALLFSSALLVVYEIIIARSETSQAAAAKAAEDARRAAADKAAADKAAADKAAADKAAADRAAADRAAADRAAADRAAAGKAAADRAAADRAAAGKAAADKAAADKVAAEKGAVAIQKFTTVSNRDIYGQDIPMPDGQVAITGIDLAKCAAQCDGEPKCVGFSFDRWNRWCFLKRKATTLLRDPHSIIGIKRPSPMPNESKEGERIERRYGRRFPGKPNSRKNASDYPACEKVCRDDQSCIAFNFLKDVGKINSCEIFYDPQEAYQPDKSSDVGYKTNLPR